MSREEQMPMVCALFRTATLFKRAHDCGILYVFILLVDPFYPHFTPAHTVATVSFCPPQSFAFCTYFWMCFATGVQPMIISNRFRIIAEQLVRKKNMLLRCQANGIIISTIRCFSVNRKKL